MENDDHDRTPTDPPPDPERSDEQVGRALAVAGLAAVAVVLMLLMATGVIDFPLV